MSSLRGLNSVVCILPEVYRLLSSVRVSQTTCYPQFEPETIRNAGERGGCLVVRVIWMVGFMYTIYCTLYMESVYYLLVWNVSCSVFQER